jgi:hypothetical protein
MDLKRKYLRSSKLVLALHDGLDIFQRLFLVDRQDPDCRSNHIPVFRHGGYTFAMLLLSKQVMGVSKTTRNWITNCTIALCRKRNSETATLGSLVRALNINTHLGDVSPKTSLKEV